MLINVLSNNRLNLSVMFLLKSCSIGDACTCLSMNLTVDKTYPGCWRNNHKHRFQKTDVAAKIK